MISTYFYNLNSVGEIKSMYIALAKQHHTSLTMMAIINGEYHQTLARMNGQPDGKYTYRYNAETEQRVTEQIVKCLESGIFHHSLGVELGLLGTWLWAYGDTYPHRATLAELGFAREYKRRMWYWKPHATKQPSRQPLSGFAGAFAGVTR